VVYFYFTVNLVACLTGGQKVLDSSFLKTMDIVSLQWYDYLKLRFFLLGRIMKKALIAYQGEKFTIEWYCDDKGNSSVLEYYKELSIQQKNKLNYLFNIISNSGTIRSEEKFRYEGDQIYAFKPAPDRFLCFFYEGSKIIVTNAYVKKTDKMPPREKTKAMNAKADYIKRYKKGIYYE